jgi:hypothetical protein
MENLVAITICLVNTIFDHANMFLSSLSDGGLLLVSGSGVTVALIGTVVYGTITEGVLASIRRWHGSIDEQFSNINNLVSVVTAHQPSWSMPPDLLQQLTGNRDQLQELINKCRTNLASAADRELRNTLLKSTVGLCLVQVKYGLMANFPPAS